MREISFRHFLTFILFPQSKWAPKSTLMAAYAYYSQDYYEDALAELERFLKVYPFYENLDYAYYLMGLCYYEQIIDEKKDLRTIIKAKETIANFEVTNFQEMITKLPVLSDLPPPTDAILPGMPLPNIPVPQKEANCTECSAKFTIKDLRLTKVTCPICSATVEL